jgi:2-polyprenyl-3-methyl-5-hydroxy-6-metoxy-1,4-benzoquinol methylase
VGETYRDIQLPFFDAWCTPTHLAGKLVLDFGCGNGFFSASMAGAVRRCWV